MRERKTIRIADMLDWHDRAERASLGDENTMRGIRVMVSSLLMDAGAYRGYREDGQMRFYYRGRTQ